MRSTPILCCALLILLMLAPVARSQSGDDAKNLTIQVAAFPDLKSAESYVAKLSRAGESPVWGMVDLPGRGKWARIFVGSFKTFSAARRYGNNLISRGAIREFLIKPASDIQLLSRPRFVVGNRINKPGYESRPIVAASKSIESESLAQPPRLKQSASSPEGGRRDGDRGIHSSINDRRPVVPMVSTKSAMMLLNASVSRLQPAFMLSKASYSEVSPLPASSSVELALAPSVEVNVARPDPVRLAFKSIAGASSRYAHFQQPGGLWLSGDTEEGMKRLRWIAGAENADLFSLDDEGRVHINAARLAEAAQVSRVSPSLASLAALDYISSNEGLLLLAQIIQGPYRYRLHVGSRAPTLGADVDVPGSINLDNNFDSRINPYRRQGRKLDYERPPDGFDCLIGINPDARWLNLRVNRLVPVAHITFHELAEAYGKIALGLGYLGQTQRPGAHGLAIEREKILESQRPSSEVVVTAGSNRVLKSEDDLRRFRVQANVAFGSRR